MFDGRKTVVFWLGILILGGATFAFFWSTWIPCIYYITHTWHSFSNFAAFVPIAFGSLVFMLIGLYMMKSGVVEEESAS